MTNSAGSIGALMAGPYEALADLVAALKQKLAAAPEHRWCSAYLFSGDQIVHTIERPREHADTIDEVMLEAASYARGSDVDGVVVAWIGERIFLAPGTYEKEGDGHFKVFTPPDPPQPVLATWAETKYSDRVIAHDVYFYPRPVTTGSIEIVEEEHVDTDRDAPNGPRAPLMEPLRKVWQTST